MIGQPLYIPAVAVTTIPGIVISNLDSTGLRIEWSIRRDNTPTPDEGEVIIYNLAPALTDSILAAWQVVKEGLQFGQSLTLAVGWNRVPKEIGRFDIVEFIPAKRTPTDVMTIWRVGDATERLRDQSVARTFSNVNIATVLDYLVQLPPAPSDAGGGGLGLTFPPESKALITTASGQIPLQSWGNITMGMSTREAIDAIMETLGLEWRIHNGAFIAMRGGLINRPGPQISPSSGLLDYTTKDDGGIVFTALADSRFEPGIRCEVLDNNGRPFGLPSYRVESVVFTGSTDEASLMEVTGRKPFG